MLIDVHQHLWTDPLVYALTQRSDVPFVRRQCAIDVLHLAGEPPSTLDLRAERPLRRAALVRADGLDRALVCLSSPLGIEALPRAGSQPLLDAYLEGALSLPTAFGVWGAVCLDDPRPGDVDEMLRRGCVGLSVPAGAIGDREALSRVHGILARLEACDVPLFVHPGPGPHTRAREHSASDPPWWSALTGYVADMQAAWLAFHVAGRRAHPSLRVIFAMLAGLAPLHAERLHARGAIAVPGLDARLVPDPLLFYETSSYGPVAIGAISQVVGAEQLLYGSDRPVLSPPPPAKASLARLGENAARALGERRR